MGLEHYREKSKFALAATSHTAHRHKIHALGARPFRILPYLLFDAGGDNYALSYVCRSSYFFSVKNMSWACLRAPARDALFGVPMFFDIIMMPTNGKPEPEDHHCQ